MSSDVIVYVPKNELGPDGKTVQETLNDLQKEGLITSYTEILQIHFTKEQAVHIQTILEFHSIKPIESTKSRKEKK